MAERTLMSFDWAIKKILRHKENFDVLEKRAKAVLDVERMSLEERRAYQRHIENRRIENAVIETAEEKGARRRTIEFAQKLLGAHSLLPFVVEMSGLSLEEVTLLSQGKELDSDTND